MAMRGGVTEIDSDKEAFSEDMDEQLESEPSRLESHTVEDNLNNLDKLMLESQMPDQDLVASKTEKDYVPEPKVVHRQEMIDDFIRNFFIKHGLGKSLQAFQKEWHEVSQKGKIRSDGGESKVPDVKVQNQILEEKIDHLRQDLAIAKKSAEDAKKTWDKLKKEKEYHLQHHKRVQDEKTRLFRDIEKLKKLHEEYEARYEQLKEKYEAAMKEKMLIKMERDRYKKNTNNLAQTVKRLEKQDLSEDDDLPEEKQKANQTAKKSNTMGQTTKTEDTNKPDAPATTKIPRDEVTNPFLTTSFESFPTKNANVSKNFKGHNLGVTCVAVHPRKPFMATGGADHCWKIWKVQEGDMIIQGESHKDWVAGLDFNPAGTNLATCSGDSTVKIWDFVKVQCAATFTCHSQPVNSVSYHHTGDFVVTGSMDASCRLLDIPTQKQRRIFRGHVDSVSVAKFLPYSNVFMTASADKTLSLWDIRTGLCVQTLYGHINCITSADVNCKGDALVSGDVDGVVKVWDVRKVTERNQFDAGPYSVNSVAFDKSCMTIGAGCEDGQVRLFSDDGKSGGKMESVLKGHQGPISGLVFEFNTKTMVTVGADGEYKFWN